MTTIATKSKQTKKKPKADEPAREVAVTATVTVGDGGVHACAPVESAPVESAESTEAPAAPDAEPPAPSADRAHLDKIKAARAVVAEREHVWRQLKSRAKGAKEAFEEAVAELTKVIDNGEEHLPLFDGPKKSEAAATDAPPSPPPLATTEANNAWRSVPVAELGLSDKITEKLADAGCETIGALEDLRASFKGLRSISGIGQKKIDLIEDAILKWLTEHRDQAVFHPAEAKDADGGWSALADEHGRHILARAEFLKQDGPLDRQSAGKYWWDDGRAAQDNGDPITSCPWTAGEAQDDWLRGWLQSESFANGPANGPKAAE